MNIVSKFTVEKNSQYQSDPGFRNNVNFVLTFVSVIIFGLFAIRPSISTITNLVKDIEEYRNVNGILIEKISILNEVKSEPEKLASDTELIASALPNTPDEGNYIRNVNFIASKNQVQIDSVGFAIIEEEGLGALEFKLSLQGKYSQIVKFIGDFNKLLRITNVENIDISPVNENRDTVNALITGKTYFLLGNND